MICKTCQENLTIESFRMRKDSGTIMKNCRKCETKARAKRKPSPPSAAVRKRKNDKARVRDKEKRMCSEHHPYYIVKDSKQSDKKKGLENDLTIEFVAKSIKNGCIHCGETSIRMTMDRIDNSLGHLQTNVEPVCYRCNMIRREMPYSAFLRIAPMIKSAKEDGLFGDWIGGIMK